MREPNLLQTSDIERLLATNANIANLAEALGARDGVVVFKGSAFVTLSVIKAIEVRKDFNTKTLTLIDLSYCTMGVEDLRTLTGSLPAALENLSLSGNNIGTEGVKALGAGLSKGAGLPKGLMHLFLGHNSVGDEGVEVLLAMLPEGLRSLDLRHNGIGDKGVHALMAGLPKLLQYFCVDGNSFGDEGAVALEGRLPGYMKNNRREHPGCLDALQIKALMARGEDLAAALRASNGVSMPWGRDYLTTRRVIEALAFTKDSETLVVIDLSFCGVGEKSVRTLAERLPAGLWQLWLCGNGIGTEGARALAAGLPKGLKSLRLGCNSIGDEGAEALAAKLRSGLFYLDLRSNGIGKKGVQALAAGLPEDLKSLSLEGNSFGNEGVEALAARLPAGLTSVQLGLSYEDEDTLLAWLGTQEPLPVADVLVLLFSSRSGRSRAMDLLASNRWRLAARAKTGYD